MILVTGATGSVGAELVPQLLAAGQAVRVLTRDPAKAARFGPGVHVATGDLGEPDTLPPALHGVHTVYLISQWAPRRRTGHRALRAGLDPPAPGHDDDQHRHLVGT